MTVPPEEPRFVGTPVPSPPIPDDDGAASRELTASLDELGAGRTVGTAVLDALVRSRLFVPVVAVLEESEVGADGLQREKQSSMATVLVQSQDGGRALLGFSSIESMNQWKPDARPVPLAAPLAARAAVDEGADTLLIDVAGPAPFAVAGHELLLVAAASTHPTGAFEDPVVHEALGRHLKQVTHVKGASLAAGDPCGPPSHAPGTAVSAVPGVLTLITDVDDRSWLPGLTAQIASDRVVARLLPAGLRVRVVTER